MAPIDRQNRMTISSIETFFDSLLRGSLTDNLFFGQLPSNIGKAWKDVVIVDCGNPMRNKDAYAQGTVLIHLYVRQNSKGVKDVKTMQKLEKSLNAIVASNTNPNYKVTITGNYSNYDAINDLFFTIVQINLIVI